MPAPPCSFLKSLVKLPVARRLIGLVIAIVLTPRRARMPLALLVIGLGTFVLVGLAGLSVIDRYLLVPSLMVMVFAAVALGGFTMLQHGARATAWARRRRSLLIVFGRRSSPRRTSTSSASPTSCTSAATRTPR